MLYLYQSNRLESLAKLCAEIQRVKPLQSALTEEEIVVQSQGMQRYLSHYLAQELGVAANLKYRLPAALTWHLMRKLIPSGSNAPDAVADVPKLNPFASEVMRWKLLKLFRSDVFQTASSFESVRETLRGYLESGESADYRLAGQLADIFDQYLVYRPEWLKTWKSGGLCGLGDDEVWQAKLWQHLENAQEPALHRVALWEALIRNLDSSKLPERYFVFGVSTMAPMDLKLLQELSRHCDVFVFALNPSEQYWGNVVEASQILKDGGEPDLSHAGHPLLASLGKQGRDFFDALVQSEEEDERNLHENHADKPFGIDSYPIFEEGEEDTLLHMLQSDIQNLNTRDGHFPETDGEALLQDGSIRIVSAHSPLRELQILKDQLLDILHKNPDWQPHDIAVLTPNIEPYSPFVGAVFGHGGNGSQALPYSVSDVKVSRRQPLLYAVELLADILESRFEVDKILALLETRPVLDRFGLTENDLPLLHDAVAELNVHWGLNAEMRGGADDLFTWQQALDRMVLGWMLPDNDGALWQNISAWHSDVNQIDTFGRFAAFIQTLADIVGIWNTPADIAEWAQRCRNLMQTLLLAGSDDQMALQKWSDALEKWQEEGELAAFDGQLPLHTALSHIRRFLESTSQAGFLCGGITFCSMVPMRSLPFKVICLLGLNDGDFPRNTKAAEFDLIAQHPKKGDRARRDDDRYLFLEALISARDILYLSYVGRDIRRDEELAPSSLVGELIDTVAGMTGMSSRQTAEHLVCQHPLQPFSHRYFKQGAERSDGIFSTRADYAEALNRPDRQVRAFFDQTLEEHQPEALITQEAFIGFWRNPVKSWLQNELGWREPYIDEAWESAEPFEPQHADKVTEIYREARRKQQDFAETAIRIRAESLLPGGELGKCWEQKFQNDAKKINGDILNSPKLPPFSCEIALDGQIVQADLGNLYRCGQVFYLNRSENAPTQIAMLLEHLIFCAAVPQGSDSEVGTRQTHIVLPDEIKTYAAVPQEKARSLLQQWTAFYNIGQNRPLPFFARVSLAAAEEFGKKQQWDSALKAARIKYHGGKGSKGQKDYSDVQLVFGSEETEPLEQPLFQNLVKLLAESYQACSGEEEDGSE